MAKSLEIFAQTSSLIDVRQMLCTELEKFGIIHGSNVVIESFVEKSQWRRSGVFVVKFEHISLLALVFLLLTLSW